MNSSRFLSKTMSTKYLAVACLLSLACLTVHAEPLTGAPSVPYAAYLGGLNKPLRATDQSSTRAQASVQFISGIPLDESVSFEINGFSFTGAGQPSGYGGGVDLALRDPDGRPGLLLLAGFGGQHRFVSKDDLLPYANIGAGLIMPLNTRLKLRVDARLYAVRETTAAAGRDLLFEARMGVGLELAYLSPFGGDRVSACGDACAPPVDAVPFDAAPIDADQDRIPDTLDQCPDTPVGMVVSTNGCNVAVGLPTTPPPAPLPEQPQLCPLVELPSLQLDGSGCLLPQVAQVYEITFEEGDTKLTDKGALAVDALAVALLAKPDLDAQIISHTDLLGPQSSNLMLSERRAQLVLARLVGRGVAIGRLNVEGAGEVDPLSDRARTDRTGNDRIELRIVASGR